MIQTTNARLSNTTIAPMRQNASDVPEHWGHWSGQKHYSLEVVQHPLRARMCGFGDKDRRPLAPAAVAKMIVRREDHSLVDIDDVDCSFFLVTVDLWSADAKHEMNLVLHPSSADRYVPTHTSKPRRRGASISGTQQRSGQQTPINSRSSPTPQYRPSGEGQSPSATPVQPAFNGPNYAYTQQPAPMPEAVGFQATQPYVPTPETAPSWGYPPQHPPADRTTYPPPVFPSIHTFGRNTSPSTGVAISNPSTTDVWHTESAIRDEAGVSAYRAWNTDGSYTAIENTSPHAAFSSSAVDPSLPAGHTSPHNGVEGTQWPQSPASPVADPTVADRYTQEPFSPQFDNSMYASASYAQHQSQPQYYHGSYSQNASGQGTPPTSSIPPLPRHTYTRTLVGPLSSNACRLHDEHRKPGIFFLFQDLSVRTEGTFRLRLRLMNVGAPPAPEAGALRVHTEVSPVLAQTFTEPFVVFSAKRFPGVPDTTALSIAFGNQGQKLPLRNRHGSSKQGRRRARGDSDGSEDDSDGA